MLQDFLYKLYLLDYIQDYKKSNILENKQMFRLVFEQALSENNVNLLREIKSHDKDNYIQYLIKDNLFPHHNISDLTTLQWLNETYVDFPLEKLLLFIVCTQPKINYLGDYICKHYDIYSATYGYHIIGIAMNTNIKWFKKIIDSAPLNYELENIHKLIERAIMQNNIDCLRYLLSICPNINYSDYRVVYYAIDCENPDILNILIKHGLDVFSAASLNPDPRLLEATQNMQSLVKNARYI